MQGNGKHNSAEISKRPGRPRVATEGKTLLAQRLQSLCRDKTFSEIADILGVSDDTAASYLRGDREPKPSQLTRLIAATGCDPGWLLTGDQADVLGRNQNVIAEMVEEYTRKKTLPHQTAIVRARKAAELCAEILKELENE